MKREEEEVKRKRAPSIIESTLGTMVITNVSDFMLAFPCMLAVVVVGLCARAAISLVPSLSLSPMSLRLARRAAVDAAHSSLFLIIAASVFLLF